MTPLDAREPANRAPVALNCERVSFAAGHGLCLTADRGVFTTYQAVLLDAKLQAVHTIKLAGSPRPHPHITRRTGRRHHRVRDRSGAPVRGHVVLHEDDDCRRMATGDEIGDLESFATWRDGKRISAKDFNFWGVTFARDSNVFYATLKTAGKTYLVRGDLGLRKVTVLRRTSSVPRCHPDNRLIGFRSASAPARVHGAFTCSTSPPLAERPVEAETRSIDDQLEWLDDAHVLYGAPRADRPSSRDVWVAPIDGSGPRAYTCPTPSLPSSCADQRSSQPRIPPRTISQTELTRNRASAIRLATASPIVNASTSAARPRCHEHHGHQGQRRDVHAVERGARHDRPSQQGHERSTQRDEHERGQENAERGDGRTRSPAEHIADERCRREHGPGRYLADRDRVDQLRLGEPVEPLDEISPQQREEHITASKQHRARLGKHGEQRPQPEGDRGRRRCGRGPTRRDTRISKGARSVHHASGQTRHDHDRPGAGQHQQFVDAGRRPRDRGHANIPRGRQSSQPGVPDSAAPGSQSPSPPA